MAELFHPSVADAPDGADPRPLARQLGSADELASLSPVAGAHFLNRIHSLPALRDFLRQYQSQILGPHEFRHVVQAHELAGQGLLRELLALDHSLAGDVALRDFQLASRAAGRRQLNRLHPLRDLRLVQRYRDAVNAGEAQGWHTLVYGLVLATYSIPLRQGLLHYGKQTMRGFILGAAKVLDLSHETILELQLEMAQPLPAQIEGALPHRELTLLT